MLRITAAVALGSLAATIAFAQTALGAKHRTELSRHIVGNHGVIHQNPSRRSEGDAMTILDEGRARGEEGGVQARGKVVAADL